MSFAVSAALQKAVFQALSGVSAPVFDTVPPGGEPPLYVALGPETVRDASDKTGTGAVHTFTISVLSTHGSFAKAKAVAGEVCDALIHAAPALERGRIVSLLFANARAVRIRQGAGRQIDLRFKARVEDF